MLRLLLFILSLLLVISISFGVIINVSNCGILDQAYPGTEYRLNQSISISGVCLTLNTNPIYLDCQNYNITGDGTLRGIDVTVSADGSIIKNCNIYDFQIGLFISSADDTIVDNLSIYNSSFGFYLFQQYNLTINNSYVENTSYGVFLDSNSDNNKIYNSNFMKNIYSIYFQNISWQKPDNNTFENNILGNETSVQGFTFPATPYNFSSNYFDRNIWNESGSGAFCFPPGLEYICDVNATYALGSVSSLISTSSNFPNFGFSSFVFFIFNLFVYFMFFS